MNPHDRCRSSSSPRVALVTGAAQGIGHAAAARFLAEGWSVAMLDWKTDVLDAAAAAFRQPDRILALPKDVSQPADVAAAVEAVRARFGRLDALVNNAGIAHFGPLMDTPLEAWNEVMAVNLTGPFIMTKAAVPLMRETGGAIVNITSISGLSASDAAGRLWHVEGGARPPHQADGGGTCELRHPCECRGPGSGRHGHGQEGAFAGDPRRLSRRHPAQPLWPAEELADAIVYLCSPGASYITGQTLAVDGGFDATGIGLPTLRRDQKNG